MCDKMRESPLLSDDITPVFSFSVKLSHPSDSGVRQNTSSGLWASPSFRTGDNHDCSTKVLNANSFIQPPLHGCQSPKRGKCWNLYKNTWSVAAWIPESLLRVTEDSQTSGATHRPDVYHSNQTISLSWFYPRHTQKGPKCHCLNMPNKQTSFPLFGRK